MDIGCLRRCTTDEAPEAVRGLVATLVPALVGGSHPALAALREQFLRGRLDSIEFSGVGLFAEFEVRPTCRWPSRLTSRAAQTRLARTAEKRGRSAANRY